MNNIDLLETLTYHNMKLIQPIEEGVIGSEVLRFIKDSGKLIFQIKNLKSDQELFLDLLEPVGFVSILKNSNDTYTFTLVIAGKKSRSKTVNKASEVYIQLLRIFKDQLTTGLKDLKVKYEKTSN